MAARVSLCFLVEEQYRRDGMPRSVIHQLRAWGHRVDVVRPGGELLDLNTLVERGHHDAWVLKTVSGGPGLGLLEAAAAAGLTTINDARSIRGVRDKARAAALAAAHGLPVPTTWAAARPRDLARIPAARFPLVVKPADGSSGRDVRVVERPEHLAAIDRADQGLLIAQPFVPNSGVDLKVYCVDGRIYATERTSPLHTGGRKAADRPVQLDPEIADIAARVGAVFGLDLYGIDVVRGPDGPIVVDVNDFPSFGQVPAAVPTVARAIVELARGGSAWQFTPRSRESRFEEPLAVGTL
ncbi:ATP-grasp domain-containing protein [Nocardia sp. NBC_01503]|uniref:ATP-grasp domain-containing protein n=1 Tax=Nocardia sp. NBC_01503 TaxID=2975997 RepID=UPI002E7AC344|nr:ATP-grasp domain-containing protein [Nocardia sp. NBC_01503]WTL31981.1 ATP-grasp domain-containing protein [Nocardia sp. NBC_01503]